MKEPINRYLDAAVLKPEFSRDEAIEAIKECIKYNTKTVCVRPCDIELAKEMCNGTDTLISCVLNFPHGNAPSKVKAYEAKCYIEKGADEIDMVANYGFIRSSLWGLVEDDIKSVAKETKEAGIVLKVILETCYLSKEQIQKATKIAIKAGADYVKTSTGFGNGGATVEAVEAMLQAGEGNIKVKASGGIRDFEKAKLFVDMGVERLGTNFTASKSIVEGTKNNSNSNY